MYEFSKVTDRIQRSEIRELLKLTRKPGIISFGAGLPDASLFPIEDFKTITNEVLTKKGYLALQYGPTEGENEFLEAISAHMKDWGEEVTLENLLVTTSSQQGIDLVTHLFIEPGDPVIMELPSYLGSIQAFQSAGASMIGVKMDTEGIMPDELEHSITSSIQAGKKPKFIYVIPDFQNPSGINMNLERRQKILDISTRYGVPIVEDSPYREMNFTDKTLPSLWTLSKGKGVILLKTLSKMLLPGMRLGWMVAEPEVIGNAVKFKQSIDLCSSAFNQFIIAEYIRLGKMKQTIENAIALYKQKKDVMLAALEKSMPEGVEWSKPYGGMFLWVTLPENIDSTKVFLKAIENNVAYVIGRPFHCDGSGSNTLRLNYSFPSFEQINTGIGFLGKAIREAMQ